MFYLEDPDGRPHVCHFRAAAEGVDKAAYFIWLRTWWLRSKGANVKFVCVCVRAKDTRPAKASPLSDADSTAVHKDGMAR